MSVILHVDACLSIQLLLHVYFCLVGCAFAGVYFSRAIGIDFIITNSNKVQRRVSSYTEEFHVSEIDCKKCRIQNSDIHVQVPEDSQRKYI